MTADHADQLAYARALDAEPVKVTRRQRQVMLRIAGGLELMADDGGRAWLYDVSSDPKAWHEVERISDVLAERLILRGLVHGRGTLSPLGRQALGLCRDCGHAGSDHHPRMGCAEALLDTDGETWLGCPCNLEQIQPPAPTSARPGEEQT